MLHSYEFDCTAYTWQWSGHLQGRMLHKAPTNKHSPMEPSKRPCYVKHGRQSASVTLLYRSSSRTLVCCAIICCIAVFVTPS